MNKICFVQIVAIAVVMAIIVCQVVSVCVLQYGFYNGYYYESAPDGTYLQKDWGYAWSGNETVDKGHEGGWATNVTEWSFVRCEHGPGPLHGDWKVADGVSVPLWAQGVFPVDATLWITLRNNVIIDVSVSSDTVYGDLE